MTTTDLITWLRAQLDEDERVARAAPAGPWSTPGPDTIAEWTVYDAHWAVAEARAYTEPTTIMPHLPKPEDYIDANATAAHIARHNPARVLAEVEAKRQILDAYERARDAGMTAFQTEYEAGRAAGFEAAVEILALPYADRPGYREEWRP